MRIAYLVSEYFLWGRSGGYGSITRALAEGLAARGHAVSVLVPRPAGAGGPDEREERGVRVIALPAAAQARFAARERYRRPRAELFVSVDARLDSWLALRAAPGARHAVWLLDPMDFATWWGQHRADPRLARPGERLAQRAAFTALRGFARLALRRADAVWSQPRALPASARAALGWRGPVGFAPNPVEIPAEPPADRERPLVLFLGRLDWQKQPERFIALARRRPDLDFVAAGRASDPGRDAALRREAAGVANLSLPGLVGADERDRLLARTRVLCNTSLREGLPRSFQEALAHGCALLAAVDPDGLVARFGHCARDGDFEGGLDRLLAGERWRALGAAGRQAIAEHYEAKRALDIHESLYRELLA